MRYKFMSDEYVSWARQPLAERGMFPVEYYGVRDLCQARSKEEYNHDYTEWVYVPNDTALWALQAVTAPSPRTTINLGQPEEFSKDTRTSPTMD